MQIKKTNWRKKLFNIFIWLVLIYLLYLAGGYVIQRRIVFPAHHTRHDPQAAERFPELDIWRIETRQGKTAAWFLPARGIEGDETAPAVIFACGNAELAEDWAPLLEPYRAAGIHVLIPDYRGYGFSDGSPSEKNIVADFTAFYDRLANHAPVDETRIFFHGRSLGGGVVCALSRRRRPEAIILSSTFTSVHDISGRLLFPPFLIRDSFNNLKAVRQYDGPLLILHGREDLIIPYGHAGKLRKNAADAKIVPLPGGHNDLDPYSYGGEAWDHIFQFLQERSLRVYIQ